MTGSLIALVILWGLSGFFSGTETAFTSLSTAQVQELKRNYPRAGDLIERLLQRPNILITTILIGNNIVNIAAPVIATEATIRLIGDEATAIMTGVLTLIVLIFGEVAPKQLAFAHNVTWARRTARIIQVLSVVLRPVVWFISGVGTLFMRMTGGQKSTGVTLEGIIGLVSHAENVGILERYKTRMVRNVFRFSEVSAQAIMTQRTEVFSLDSSTGIGEALPRITDAGFSRVPVYDEDPENIVGVVLVRDLMKEVLEGRREPPLKRVMVSAIFVQAHRKIYEVFTTLRQAKMHLAVVLDEYGGVAGIVTIEDIVEEVLGEIYDENEERGRDRITQIGPRSFTILADTPVYVVNDYFGVELPQDRHAQTIGGYLVGVIGRIPAAGEQIESPFGTFTVTNISRKRIVAVRYDRPEDPEKPESPSKTD